MDDGGPTGRNTKFPVGDDDLLFGVPCAEELTLFAECLGDFFIPSEDMAVDDDRAAHEIKLDAVQVAAILALGAFHLGVHGLSGFEIQHRENNGRRRPKEG